MKLFVLMTAFVLCCSYVKSQELQLNYDLRHTVDPVLHKRNFPTLYFKYFKQADSNDHGSFLIQVQSLLNGKNSQMGETFVQVSQTIKYWKAPVYLALNYTAGLGVTDNAFGYTIQSSYGIGLAKNFLYPTLWITTGLYYRTNSTLTSHDAQMILHIGGGFLNYKLIHSGSFVFWTIPNLQNNHKLISFFGDPQIWYSIGQGLFLGCRINVFHHVFKEDDSVQVYPSLGIKKSF